MTGVDPRYLEAMMPLFTRIGYQEKSVARCIARAAHTAHLRAAAERYYAKATRLGLRPTAIPSST